MEEYDRQDASFYDYYATGRPRDVGFYVEEARRAGSPVLELGCGTARILIPVAEAGVEIVGLDRAPSMLAVARDKVGKLPPETQRRIELLGRRFNLAMIPYRAFVHLLTVEDQLRALHSILDHLVDGGRLVLNIFDPSLEIIIAHRGPLGASLKLESGFIHPETGHRVLVWDTRQYEREEQVLRQYFVFEELDEDGPWSRSGSPRSSSATSSATRCRTSSSVRCLRSRPCTAISTAVRSVTVRSRFGLPAGGRGDGDRRRRGDPGGGGGAGAGTSGEAEEQGVPRRARGNGGHSAPPVEQHRDGAPHWFDQRGRRLAPPGDRGHAGSGDRDHRHRPDRVPRDVPPRAATGAGPAPRERDRGRRVHPARSVVRGAHGEHILAPGAADRQCAYVVQRREHARVPAACGRVGVARGPDHPGEGARGRGPAPASGGGVPRRARRRAEPGPA